MSSEGRLLVGIRWSQIAGFSVLQRLDPKLSYSTCPAPIKRFVCTHASFHPHRVPEPWRGHRHGIPRQEDLAHPPLEVRALRIGGPEMHAGCAAKACVAGLCASGGAMSGGGAVSLHVWSAITCSSALTKENLPHRPGAAARLGKSKRVVIEDEKEDGTGTLLALNHPSTGNAERFEFYSCYNSVVDDAEHNSPIYDDLGDYAVANAINRSATSFSACKAQLVSATSSPLTHLCTVPCRFRYCDCTSRNEGLGQGLHIARQRGKARADPAGHRPVVSCV